MSRLATHQRKANPVSRESWKVVTGETLIDTNKGPQRATGLIYHWLKQWMRATMKRPIHSRGEPLTPGFVWVSKQYFNGRPMIDVAQEFEGEALEGAGRGAETHDATKGPLIPWMRRIMMHHLTDELERWIDTSASVGEDREPHEAFEKLLGLDEDDEEETMKISRRQLRERQRLVERAMVEADPADEIEVDPTDREMCELALSTLSAMEAEALQRFAEGESYKSIARNLSLSGATSAHRIVDRARLKAQEALLRG